MDGWPDNTMPKPPTDWWKRDNNVHDCQVQLIIQNVNHRKQFSVHQQFAISNP